jgi:predicted nucleotidyltransferase
MDKSRFSGPVVGVAAFHRRGAHWADRCQRKFDPQAWSAGRGLPRHGGLSLAVIWRAGSDCAASPRSTLWFVARPAATWTVREGHALWNGRTLRDWSAPLAADLVDAFHPVEIWLFGSVARGEDGANSDLDVLVVLDAFDPATSIELKQRAQRAATVPAPFDASFTDVARMASRRHVAGTLERAVDLEGELLYRRG